MNKNTRLVYSTDVGKIKEDKNPTRPSTAQNEPVKVSREKRNGKEVTVVTGIAMDEKRLKALAKKMKQLCGTGGTTKNGRIEIQGDQRDKIMEYLATQGIKSKRAGG